MKEYYLVTLKSGASLIATDYYDISSTEYRINAVANNGLYDYDVLKQDVLDIDILTEEKVKELQGKSSSESYYLESDCNMYDMCYCCADCRKDCARKQYFEGICTVSDFSSVCSDYEEE